MILTAESGSEQEDVTGFTFDLSHVDTRDT